MVSVMSRIYELIDNFNGSVQHDRDEDLARFATSSFQTQSLPMLHLLSEHAPEIPVVFLDTGYHFEETIKFRDEVSALLNLKLIVLRGYEAPSDNPLHVVSTTSCCARNKVEPLEPLLRTHDIWITGVRSDQTDVRAQFSERSVGPHNTTRWHPMLNWTAQDITHYRTMHDLPAHPLDALGYKSIGCAPCTDVPSETDERSGRWAGLEKTECGLHLPEPATVS